MLVEGDGEGIRLDSEAPESRFHGRPDRVVEEQAADATTYEFRLDEQGGEFGVVAACSDKTVEANDPAGCLYHRDGDPMAVDLFRLDCQFLARMDEVVVIPPKGLGPDRQGAQAFSLLGPSRAQHYCSDSEVGAQRSPLATTAIELMPYSTSGTAPGPVASSGCPFPGPG